MTDTADTPPPMYATISMAEILLSQNLVQEAARVIKTLKKDTPDDPRVRSLSERLEEMQRPVLAGLPPPSAVGTDRVRLETTDAGLGIEWELTEAGLMTAKRAVRYSGRPVVRLFTAATGQRGVRTQLRDIDISLPTGRTVSTGLPRPAVHAASVGYLANTGIFVSLAQSPTVKVWS